MGATWNYVDISDMTEPILGRPILEALSIHTRDLLAAVVDKIGSSVDVSDIYGLRDPPDGSVARILHEGLYHRDRGMAGDAYEEEDEAWLNFDQGSKDEMNDSILSSLRKAEGNESSKKSMEILSALINNYRNVLRIKLGNEEPALVEAMKLELKRDATPVTTKPRRYTQEGGKFIQRYISRVI